MTAPTMPPKDDELLARYREASALDAAAPGQALRARVLAQAAQVAAQRAAGDPVGEGAEPVTSLLPTAVAPASTTPSGNRSPLSGPAAAPASARPAGRAHYLHG